jgi:hypothetical protein
LLQLQTDIQQPIAQHDTQQMAGSLGSDTFNEAGEQMVACSCKAISLHKELNSPSKDHAHPKLMQEQ